MSGVAAAAPGVAKVLDRHALALSVQHQQVADKRHAGDLVVRHGERGRACGACANRPARAEALWPGERGLKRACARGKLPCGGTRARSGAKSGLRVPYSRTVARRAPRMLDELAPPVPRPGGCAAQPACALFLGDTETAAQLHALRASETAPVCVAGAAWPHAVRQPRVKARVRACMRAAEPRRGADAAERADASYARSTRGTPCSLLSWLRTCAYATQRETQLRR